MKLSIVICFWLLTNEAFCQYKIGNKLTFIDSTQTPLEFIFNQFHDRIQSPQSPIDTSCLYALGSVKFTVEQKAINNIQVSLGIPKFIATPLKDAIEASKAVWKLDKGSKEVTVLIPLLVLPASMCRREDYRDDLLTTMANMMTYKGTPERVLRREYLKKAKGAEEGVILPPLIIRSSVNDIYKIESYQK